MLSTTSEKMSGFSLMTRSAIRVPTTESGWVPITSTHEGLTQRMVPSMLRSRMTFKVCSAASRSSSLSSRMSSLNDRCMGPALDRSEATARGASMLGVVTVPSSIVMYCVFQSSILSLPSAPADSFDSGGLVTGNE